jgi:chromosome segregation ATPase
MSDNEDLLKQYNNLRNSHHCQEQSHNDYYRILSDNEKRSKELEKIVWELKEKVQQDHNRQIDESGKISKRVDELENIMYSLDADVNIRLAALELLDDKVDLINKGMAKIEEKVIQLETAAKIHDKALAEEINNNTMIEKRMDELENSIATTDNSLAIEIENNASNYDELREILEKLEHNEDLYKHVRDNIMRMSVAIEVLENKHKIFNSRTENTSEDEFHQAMMKATKQYGLAISNLAKK